jgi:REP element-mobilizing transposase RayT
MQKKPVFDYKLFYERNLPHYQPPGATIFLTFRLADTLPIEAIQNLRNELSFKKAEIAQISDRTARKREAYKFQKLLSGRWDSILDSAEHGPKWIADAIIAELIRDAIHFRDGKDYTLEAFCLMPNHVHMVCSPIEKDGNVISLAKIMQSLKGFTAFQANRLLKRQGKFWQPESYDHVVRDNSEFKRIVDYVLNNPSQAGLPARWIYSRQDR